MNLLTTESRINRIQSISISVIYSVLSGLKTRGEAECFYT